MQDRTPYYMVAMVVIVAVAAVIMAMARLGASPSLSDSQGLTGNVVSDTGMAPSDSGESIATANTPIRSTPDAVTRMLTILSVAFCITLALYLYFHEEY